MNEQKYFNKYIKYKKKYLELKKNSQENKTMSGGNPELSIFQSEQKFNNISVYSYTYSNYTQNMLELPNEIRNMLLYESSHTSNCDFFEDENNENTPIIIEPNEHFIFIISYGRLLGYMNFMFNPNLRINNFKLFSEHYMACYIDNRCSFSKNFNNSDLFNAIKNININFSIGKYLFEKLTEYLNYYSYQIKKQYNTHYKWKYFIFNNSTQEAYNFHKNNGMHDIDYFINIEIINSLNSNNKNLFELYDLEKFEKNNYKLYMIITPPN